MKDIILNAEDTVVHVNAYGAELKGIMYRGHEYLWQGAYGTYERTSPTLFPVTGRFLSDTYYVGDKAYMMSPAGFAQRSNFTVLSVQPDEAVFFLKDSDETLRGYPFRFGLRVTYRVRPGEVTVSYRVSNTGERDMPFVLGCHTAYNWPLVPDSDPGKHELVFEENETLDSFNPFGWTDRFLNNERVKPLNRSLFENYTRSITGYRSDRIGLYDRDSGRSVRIDVSAFPYLAVWTLPDPAAAFLCLEPCTGLQPGDHPSLHIEDRDGATVLAPGAEASFMFSVETR